MPTASQVLLEEHKLIRATVDPALTAGEDISRRGPAAIVAHRASLSALADLLTGDLSRHSAKEDEIFFPAIERALGSTQGPTAVMRAEHRQIHACGDGFRQLLAGIVAEEAARTPEAAEALVERLRELGDLIGAHFEKEEVILFPLAESVLPPEEQRVVGDRLRDYRG